MNIGEPDVLCDCGGTFYTPTKVREEIERAQREAYAEGRKDEREKWWTAARDAVRTMDRFNDVVWESGSPWNTEFDEAADALRKLLDSDVAEAMREVGRRIGH